jgi:hypothetical protein
LFRIVALLVSMLAVVPTMAAADQPTPDPSLDFRPDPAPVQSQAAPAKQPATPVQKKAAEHSSSAPTQVPFASRSTTGQATSGQSATARSRLVGASRRRSLSAARASRPHERARRTNRAAAIAISRRLAPLLAAPRLLRPAARPTSSGDAGAQSLVLAGLALLLLVAASASLIRLTTRLSGDVRGAPRP